VKIDYDSLALEYAQHRRVQPQVLANLISIGRLDAVSRVLEVGCGTGNYTVALEKATACSCLGVEPSEQMLAQARTRTQTAHFHLGRAEHLDFPVAFFDMVFSVDVIHHVSDYSMYFREVYRVLQRGGKMLTATDSEDIIRRRQPLSIYFPETIEIELRRYPCISELKGRMLQVGFRDLEETVVEFPYSLTDIQIYRDKAFSCLHLISDDAFGRGIARMEQDLRDGSIPCVSRYLLLWGTK
jgi:ubiquinone/menaquinone biosynthesis C-methylase UbiE